MSKKYSDKLVDAIREKQYKDQRIGVDVIIKPIPDCDIKGAMDPRLYDNSKMMAKMMKFMPKKMMEINVKNMERLRKPFNNVDSTNFVKDKTCEKVFVEASDGYKIPVTIFKGNKTLENAPILYFIHGGGFFAGSVDVVSEALRYIVNETGIIAVGCDYRLAPENPYPTSHTDTYAVLEWIYDYAQDFGGDKHNIFVSGDSAGGNLTVYNTNRSLEEDKDYVKGQIILYPTLNMNGIQDEYTKFDINNFEIYDKHKKVIQPSLEMFASASSALNDILGTDDVTNKYLTPYMDVSDNLPVTMFTVGEHDALITETLAYAKKMTDLGNKPEFTIYKGMGHAYIDHMGNYPQAEDCAKDIGDFILRHSNRK